MPADSYFADAVAKRPFNPIDTHVGHRLKLRRTELGLSQQVIAERLGLTYQQLQKYEAGRNRIGAGRLYEIAGVLGVPLRYFYEGVAGAAQASRDAADRDLAGPSVLSVDAIKFVLAYRRIRNRAMRRQIEHLIKELVEGEYPLSPKATN